jgi:hypothetical protein
MASEIEPLRGIHDEIGGKTGARDSKDLGVRRCPNEVCTVEFKGAAHYSMVLGYCCAPAHDARRTPPTIGAGPEGSALHGLRAAFLDRKIALARLLRDTKAGILLNEHVAEDGPTVFAHACRLGAEGIVSKQVDGTYRSGPCRAWIKVRNPARIALRRERSEIWNAPGSRQRWRVELIRYRR